MKNRPLKQPFYERPWLIALLAMLLVLATQQVIEHFARSGALEQERLNVLTELSTLRARLKGAINANILLVHGLTAVISAHPDIDQTEFSRISRGLVNERHDLRNIAGAPDMVVSLMYPLAGNEAAIGLDYRTHPTQGPAALRAMHSGQSVLAGPLPLLQGGIGLIVREPVFIPPTRSDEPLRFWGLVSAVIDIDPLYRQAGLLEASQRLRLALRGVDGTGASGETFFGDPSVLAQSPVTTEIGLPGGTWQLAATPRAGWGQPTPTLWMIRVLGLVAVLAAGVIAWLLACGRQALAASEGRLRTLLATIPDLVWLKDPDGVYLACNPRFEQFFGARESEILGKRDHDFVPADLANFFREKDRAAIAASGPCLNEEWLTFASDGDRGLFETIKTPVKDAHGRILGVLGIAREITERKQAEERIRGLNRVYAVLSGINGAIVRLRDPAALYREACRIAVETGGFRMAWLGIADPASREIRPVAQAGKVDGYLDRLRISLGDDARAHGPTGLALRRGEHMVCHDIAQDPRMAPWRDMALALGYRSSAAFPIRLGGQVIGAFNLYADTPEFFDTTELRLLDELTGDLGFALEFIESEAQLRRQKEILDRTSRLAKVGGWEFDVETRQGSWTDETARIQEMEPSPRASVADGLGLFQGPSRVAIEQALREAIEESRPYELELEMTTAKGAHKWVRTIGLPIRDGARVVRVEGAIQDITSRKLAEDQARQSETLLDTVFQVLPDLFFLIDPDGTIRDYRASRSDNFYVPPEIFLDRRMRDVVPPAVADQFERNMALVAQTGRLATYEYDLPMPDGPRHFEARLNRLPDRDQFIAVVRDLTERTQAEAALQAQRQETTLLAMLLERSSQPMAVGFPDVRLGRFNQAFLDLVGYSREALARIDWSRDLTPQDWLVQEQAALEQLHRTHRPVRYEKEYIRKDGTRVPIELHVDAMIDASGKLDYYYAFVTDITERKRADNAIRQLNAELEARVQARTAELTAINKELETFTYSVSHDLKAPLRGIDGYSRLLLEDHLQQLDDEGRLFLGHIRHGVDQMNELIEDLLAYSRMERRGMQEIPLDLASLASRLVAERQEDLQTRGGSIAVDLDDVSTVRADPDGLALALRNLLDNAIKFSRDAQPPLIEITARTTEHSTILAIEDNGIGFDMQFHERIFEIFQRLQRAEDYPGTGIGLAIVRKAAQRMGGRIWAESAPGQGATFFLELPR